MSQHNIKWERTRCQHILAEVPGYRPSGDRIDTGGGGGSGGGGVCVCGGDTAHPVMGGGIALQKGSFQVK